MGTSVSWIDAEFGGNYTEKKTVKIVKEKKNYFRYITVVLNTVLILLAYCLRAESGSYAQI